jgi:hypothetical protein
MKASPRPGLDQRVGAEIFDAATSRARLAAEPARLGPDADAASRIGRRAPGRCAPRTMARRHECGRQHVHRRRADEARREDRGRPLVELGRRRVLLDRPFRISTTWSAMVMASTWSCVT